MMGAEEYDRKLESEMKAANEAAVKQWETDGKSNNCVHIEEVNDDLIDDQPPSLEQVSVEQREAE